MKHFELESSMLTMGGVFYPTGYMVLMLPGEQEARAAISADAECAVLDGIYFENTTRTNSNAQLRVYVDLQGDEGAERHEIRRLTDLGTLIEEYGDGNLIDPRDYVTVGHRDDETNSRLLSPGRASALIASDPEWGIFPR